MLTAKEIILLKKDGYTFEEIQSIKKGFQDIEEGKTIPEKEFWSLVKSDINNFINMEDKCIK